MQRRDLNRHVGRVLSASLAVMSMGVFNKKAPDQWVLVGFPSSRGSLVGLVFHLPCASGCQTIIYLTFPCLTQEHCSQTGP